MINSMRMHSTRIRPCEPPRHIRLSCLPPPSSPPQDQQFHHHGAGSSAAIRLRQRHSVVLPHRPSLSYYSWLSFPLIGYLCVQQVALFTVLYCTDLSPLPRRPAALPPLDTGSTISPPWRQVKCSCPPSPTSLCRSPSSTLAQLLLLALIPIDWVLFHATSRFVYCAVLS